MVCYGMDTNITNRLYILDNVDSQDRRGGIGKYRQCFGGTINACMHEYVHV